MNAIMKYNETVDEFKQDYRDYYELIAERWSVDTILQYLDEHNLTDSTLIISPATMALIGDHFLSGKGSTR
jgi:hypothetical protein